MRLQLLMLFPGAVVIKPYARIIRLASLQHHFKEFFGLFIPLKITHKIGIRRADYEQGRNDRG